MTEDIGRIHRHNYESHFSILPHHIVEHEHLSWMAKSILWYLLSRPLNWKVYRSQLAKIYKGNKRGNGKDAVDSAFDELLQYRFIIYTAKDKSTGKFIHRYDVYPDQQPEIEEIKEKIPKPVKPVMDSTPNGLNTPQTRKYSLPISIEENNNKPPAVAAQAVVVFPILNELGISEDLKIKISSEHDEEKVIQLVNRVKAWSGRESDAKACNTILRDWDKWEHTDPNEDQEQENIKYIESLKSKDGKKLGIYTCEVSPKYILFRGGAIDGSKDVCFKAEQKGFKRLIEDFILENR